ncbi:response regulator transcription factor [Parvularcula flava]|uniref:DNA-binding response regulator n=1 Tax=Aquisalinus luteolus TaxID=1566827 RepID=A0A8J3A281_9PROT|nr:response regulator transcription factor [Aquisalinus luteolus]NHK28131.1 response regulator transcription factor [Aquisalinus luteolus]GGH97556.1 DNA-binding response regulator [Aquisalinus luteolus]
MARAKRILLVDDDDLLRETLLDQFDVHDEFKVDVAENAAAAIDKVKQEAHIDIVLLDVGLPDMDGRDACRVMRKNGFKSPIIMLTGADSEADTILGLDAGANDYVTKPFKFSVLLARLRAHLRSHEQSEDAVFKVGPYEFKPAVKMLVTENDRKIKLTEKETSILKYLYRSGGQPVSREKLLDEVWGYNSGVTTHTLETHIYRLRQKIEPDTSQASLLLTEAGGYRLALDR